MIHILMKQKFLGVGDDVEAIKKQIVTALQKSFSISESEAETLVDLSKKDFTQYYLKNRSIWRGIKNE